MRMLGVFICILVLAMLVYMLMRMEITDNQLERERIHARTLEAQTQLTYAQAQASAIRMTASYPMVAMVLLGMGGFVLLAFIIFLSAMLINRRNIPQPQVVYMITPPTGMERLRMYQTWEQAGLPVQVEYAERIGT